MSTNAFEFSYIFNAIPLCTTEKELDGVGKSIKHCVRETHPEYPLLIEAGKLKRLELQRGKAA